MNKLLSIIVPSYNMEKYLPKCLGSLVVDDPALLEKLDVIVVNDGSTDRTSEIAHGFATRYPSAFRVIDKPNGHYGSCINAALPVAEGVYVKVLDADDWFDTKNFETFLRGLLDVSEDVVITDFDMVDLDGKIIEPHRNIVEAGTHSISQWPEEVCCNLPMHTVTYRLSLLRQIGYRQTEGVSYTDLEWVYMPMGAVSTCRYMPIVVYKYVFGREGQSCSPDQWLKQIGAQIPIVCTILSYYLKYKNQFHPDARRYMHTRMLCRVRRIYSYFLLEYRHVLPMEKLIAYDKFLKEQDERIYDEVGEVELSRKLHFHYIREWRKKQSRTTIKFYGFLIYMKLMRFLSRFR